ncbi:MAG: hypothetical protein INQ03_20625 [Candidatus Heimdallarchaeota archaeon]|nr:hypothetical protein [Candidatus Heimdallarchaeota archaeon]
MKFDNLSLVAWSYEKGDKSIAVDSLDLSDSIKRKNPVSHTYVYSDESEWKDRLGKHVARIMETSGVKGSDVQAIFGVHNGYQKHPEGAGPPVHAVLENTEAFMVEMTNGCASMIIAAQMAGLHMSEESIENVVLGSVQLTTQYTNNCTDGNCIFADSIGAVLFAKSDTGHMIKYTDIQSDSQFGDMFQMDEHAIYTMQNLQKGRDLSQFMVKSFQKQLMQGCRVLNTFPKDLDFIAISCSSYAATKMVLDSVNFPLERTGIECLTQIPHMGTNDLMAQLEYGIEKGMIQKGSKILVTGTALGFSIATMAIEW